MEPQQASSADQETESFTFDQLYHEGQVYVFPYLFEPTAKILVDIDDEMPDEEQGKSVPGKAQTVDKTKRKQQRSNVAGDNAEFDVTDFLNDLVQKMTSETDLPTFILHNDKIKKDGKEVGERDVLILNRKMGVVVTEVKATESGSPLQRRVRKAIKQLLKAREECKEKLKGLVKTESITFAIALPGMSSQQKAAVQRCVNKVLKEEGIQNMEKVELLLGPDLSECQGLLESLARRADSDVWENISPDGEDFDSTFKAAVQKYLSVDRMDLSHDAMRKIADAHRRWLLTEDQMKVRDLPSKLVHIHGPPGSGKTLLLQHRARRWLGEGKAVVITTSSKDFDLLKARMGRIVLRDQAPASEDRLRICRDFKDIDGAVEELKSQHASGEICLITDELHYAKAFEKLINAIESGTIQQCWSADVIDSPHMDDKAMTPELAARARDLEWRNEELSKSIRCPQHVVKLLNRLLEGSGQQSIRACQIPRIRTFESVATVIVDHASHQPASEQADPTTPPSLQSMLQTLSRCEPCNRKLQEALNPDWKRWVALCTGNDVYKGLRDLATCLRGLGVPTACELNHAILGDAEIPATVLASRLREPAITGASFTAARLEAWQREEHATQGAAERQELVGGTQKGSGVQLQQQSGVELQQQSGVELQQQSEVQLQQQSGVQLQQPVQLRQECGMGAQQERDRVVAEWRERVVAGVSESGQPAMHVVWHRYFRGLEKDGVLLIHWDQDDFRAQEDLPAQDLPAQEDLPDQEDLPAQDLPAQDLSAQDLSAQDLPAQDDHGDITGERRIRHCKEWIEAASRCQGKLVVLLLSPSPARSFLPRQ